MSKDWNKCSNMYAMIDKAVLSHRCSKMVISIYSTAVLLYSTASLGFVKKIDNCRELLIKMELPFTFCESPVYEIVVFVQLVHLLLVSWAIGVLDALIVTLVSKKDRRAKLANQLGQIVLVSSSELKSVNSSWQWKNVLTFISA